jgi:hypothetical protein
MLRPAEKVCTRRVLAQVGLVFGEEADLFGDPEREPGAEDLGVAADIGILDLEGDAGDAGEAGTADGVGIGVSAGPSTWPRASRRDRASMPAAGCHELERVDEKPKPACPVQTGANRDVTARPPPRGSCRE